MKYRVMVCFDVFVHPTTRGEHTVTDLMDAIREGLRINPRLAVRVEDARLTECRLIEDDPAKVKELLREEKRHED